MIWNPPLEIPPEHVIRNREEVTERVSAVYPVPSGPTEMHVQSEVMQSRAGASQMEVETRTTRVRQDTAAASSSRQEVSCNAADQLLRGTPAAAVVADTGTCLWEVRGEDGWIPYEQKVQLRLDVAASNDAVIEWRFNKNNSYEIDPMGGSQRHLTTGKVRHVRRRGPPSGAPANVDMPAVPTRNSQGAVLEEERDPSIQVGETKARVMVERERQAQECEGVGRALESELGSKSMIPAPLEGGEILFGGSW